MKLSKERQKIYQWIKDNVGEIKPEAHGYLSDMIKNYGKLHSEVIAKELSILIARRTAELKLRKEDKPINTIKSKPIIEKPKFNPNYFNSAFLNKG